MKTRTVALAILLAGALAGSAHAQSGNITNLAPTGSGTIQATFTIDWNYCKPYGYGVFGCGWYAAAYSRPIGSDCLDDIGSILWVGDYHSDSGHESTTTAFYPHTDQAFNVCLYVHGDGSAPYLVSLNSYWPPPPPAPAPPPQPAAPEVIPAVAALPIEPVAKPDAPDTSEPAKVKRRRTKGCGTVKGTVPLHRVTSNVGCRKGRRVARRWLSRVLRGDCGRLRCSVGAMRCRAKPPARISYIVRCRSKAGSVRFRVVAD